MVGWLFLVGAKRCLNRAYFRHRIFIRFTYHPCRNYSMHSWKLSRIYSSPHGRKNFSFLPLFCLFSLSPFPWREVYPQLYIPSRFLAHCFLWITCLRPHQSTLFLYLCLSIFYVVFSYMRCPRRSWCILWRINWRWMKIYVYRFNSKVC